MTRGEFKDGGGGPVGDSGPVGDGGNKDAAPGDSGGDSSAGTTAFTGTGTFASNPPATNAATYHTNNNVGVTPGKGVDCLSCHKMGGAGQQFLFAGTIFQDQNATTPAAGVEVRVRGTDGKGYSSYSDTDGNFWFIPGTGQALAFPAQSGARNATQTALMMNNLSASSCNAGGCHDGSTQAYMHLP